MAQLPFDIEVANQTISNGCHAMPIKPTLFSSIMQQVPWGAFDRAAEQVNASRFVREFSLRSHLATMLAAQLSGARSLREIESVMATNHRALTSLDVQPAARSTLADANNRRPAEIFEALLAPLLARLPRKMRREAGEAIRLIDSTPVKPGLGAANWAHFEKDLIGAKIHVVYDPNAQVPVFFEVTSGNTNDIVVAKSSVRIEAGATYVFDLGYYDYRFWADLHAAGCTLVTRLKSNTPVTEVERRTPPPSTNVLSDRVVLLPKRLAYSRKNPFSHQGREIVVAIETGKTIRLFTNDLTSSAAEIANLYKMRWQIELFFRWIKQNLKIRKFLGSSKNAVRIQAAVAMVAYIILHLIHSSSKLQKNIQTFAAVIRQNLFHKTTLRDIIDAIMVNKVWKSKEPPPQMVLL